MYNFETLKEAILFNTAETLPTDINQLDNEIRKLVDVANQQNIKIRHYIGYEISGKLHFGNATYQMLKVAKLQKAGVECCLWLADYHTWINKKLDGKMETISYVAQNYFVPVFKKTLEVCEGNPEELVILFPKNEYFKPKNDIYYWDTELEVESKLSLSRVLRSLSIAGKEAGADIDYQVTRYPGMQAADVFWLQTHLVQAGLDQRKIYVSCRDVALKIDEKFQLKIGTESVKPIAMHNSLLLGMEKPEEAVLDASKLTKEEQKNLMYLQEEMKEKGQVNLKEIDQTVASSTIKIIQEHKSARTEINKMSKSRPDSAIFVHDSEEEILRKLKKAYCPMPNKDQTASQILEEQEWNPILDWCKKMIFPAQKTILVERKEEWGGNIEYTNFNSLFQDYISLKLHPMDLKIGVAKCLGNWFKPIREAVEQNPEALKLIDKIKKA